MPRFVGSNGIVTVAGTAVAEVQSFDVSDERAVARAPSMGQGYVGHGIGAPAYTGTIRCMMDPDDGGQQAAFGTAPVTLTLQPQGLGTGLPQIVFSAVYISGIPRAVASEEFATIEFSFVADSAPDETPQT